jgi:hypothetical protein
MSARGEVQEVRRLGAQVGNEHGSGPSMARAAEHGVLTQKGNDDFYSLLGVVRRFVIDRLKQRHGMGSTWRGDV